METWTKKKSHKKNDIIFWSWLEDKYQKKDLKKKDNII